MRPSLVLLAAALTVAAFAPAQAQDGRPRRERVVRLERPPLNVTRRSFLDSGTQVPVGSTNAYVQQSTTLNQPIYRDFDPDRFGGDVLPRRFDPPGQYPLLTFETPRF